jgi:hypothetical protein
MKLGFASDLQDMSRLTEVEVGTIADDVNTEERLEVVCLGDLVAVGSVMSAGVVDAMAKSSTWMQKKILVPSGFCL